MRLVASLSTLVALGVVAAATPAAAQVPPTLQLAGRLTTPDGTPLDGTYDVELRLYGSVSGGTAVWTELHDSVVADDGAVYLAPGASTPFGAGVFDGGARWLEIRVDGTTLSPRLAVASVPYAFRADVANVAAMLGDYAPEDLQPKITGMCAPGSSIRAIDDDGTLSCEPDDVGGIGDITRVTAGVGFTGGGETGDVTLAADTAYLQRRVAGTCPTGSSIRTIAADGTVGCETDDDSPATTYTGGAGVAITGTTVSLSSAGCVAGEVWKWTGAGWSCEPDVDTSTTYSAGAGVAITGTTVSLGTSGCVAGDVWKWNGSAWSCDPDVDTSTTYSAGAGVAITGTTVSLSTTGCVAGEVWKWSGTAWACEPDANTVYTAGSGVTLTGNAIATDNAVVARKDSAAGSQNFDSNTLFIDYGTNRTGLGTNTPRERLDVEGPAELDTLRIFRKYGNNGTTSCEAYCRGDNWGGGTGVCLSAKATEVGPDGNAYRVYIGCDVVPGFGSAPACICGGIYD